MWVQALKTATSGALLGGMAGNAPASCLPAKLEGVFFTLNSAEVDLGCDSGGEPCGRLCCTCGEVSSLRNLGFGWG